MLSKSTFCTFDRQRPTIRNTPPDSGAVNCASPPDSIKVQPGGCHRRNQCEGSMYVRQCGGCLKLMVLDARSDGRRHVGPSSCLFRTLNVSHTQRMQSFVEGGGLFGVEVPRRLLLQNADQVDKVSRQRQFFLGLPRCRIREQSECHHGLRGEHSEECGEGRLRKRGRLAPGRPSPGRSFAARRGCGFAGLGLGRRRIGLLELLVECRIFRLDATLPVFVGGDFDLLARGDAGSALVSWPGSFRVSLPVISCSCRETRPKWGTGARP